MANVLQDPRHLVIVILNFLLSVVVIHAFAKKETQFIYNGFKGSNNKLVVDGLANIHQNGLLQMTDRDYATQNTSHVFYTSPVVFEPRLLSFSTTFVFTMIPQIPKQSGSGMAFLISPSMNFQHSFPSTYLGLFNSSTNGLKSNHVFAVELDTVLDHEVKDIDGNHVGVDVNSLYSVAATTAAYYSDKKRRNISLLLNSGKTMQVWIDYDEVEKVLNITLAPFRSPKPSRSLLSIQIDLSTVLLDTMYIGFSSSTDHASNSHYILGWSWNQNGKAQDLDHSKLPKVPRIKHQISLRTLIFVLLLLIALLLMLMVAGVVWFVWRKRYKELLEPWEKEYAPHRFSYKDLYVATKGFKNSEIIGIGGFGKVYKGVLPSTSYQVAVKRVSHDSKREMKEFVEEISSMRRLRHRNLVQLLGYCRREGELLLIYEYMPNGSLDKLLFDKVVRKSILSWSMRFKIIKGVASALQYLHQEWEQVILHRDVKASNVLLDAEMNARLGDFGLARLNDHNIGPQRTNVVGTIGYIAPEVSRTGKSTISTDVFAFGMFILEVGCGRKPIGKQSAGNEAESLFLSDWVYNCWKRGEILKASDPRIEREYQENEMELVLKLGLLCLHPKVNARPSSMKHVVQFLDGSATLPDIPSDYDPVISAYPRYFV